MIWPFIPTGISSSSIQIWNGIWVCRGTAPPESCTSSAEAIMDGGVEAGNGRRSMKTVILRFWTWDQPLPPVYYLEQEPDFRRNIKKPYLGWTGPMGPYMLFILNPMERVIQPPQRSFYPDIPSLWSMR